MNQVSILFLRYFSSCNQVRDVQNDRTWSGNYFNGQHSISQKLVRKDVELGEHETDDKWRDFHGFFACCDSKIGVIVGGVIYLVVVLFILLGPGFRIWFSGLKKNNNVSKNKIYLH